TGVGPFGLDHVISVATQVCEVLSAAHRQGVIHRDLKPDNIMVMPTGRGRYAAKVLDFGIAKIVDDDHQHGPMTETGSVFGTPEFMSPEQCRGDEADPRSDLYAMGIILFYMATGKLPFKGKNKLIILNKQLHDKPPRPSMAREDIDVPHGLESVILKCLNKDPDQRYQSADDLLEALEEAAAGGDARGVPGSETARLGQPGSEAGDSPKVTRSQPPQVSGVADIHGSETVRRDLSHTMNTDPDRAAQVDLGTFDDSAGTGPGLDEVDLPGEWAEREPVSYDRPRRWKPVAVVIVALLVLGGVVWGLGAGNDGARDVPSGAESGQDQLAAADGAAADLEVDRVLITGQVLGSLAAAEDNLEHGDLAAARRSLETTYMWLDDEQLSQSARERRTALADELDHREAQRKAKKQRAEQQAAEKREAAKRAAKKRKEEEREAARQEAQRQEAQRQAAARKEERQREEERKAAEEKETHDEQAAQAERRADQKDEQKDEQEDEPEEEGALPPRRLD
ncbi:MAG: protein kinase domain-containing protein, partial [Persicimonas sp.]